MDYLRSFSGLPKAQKENMPTKSRCNSVLAGQNSVSVSQNLKCKPIKLKFKIIVLQVKT